MKVTVQSKEERRREAWKEGEKRKTEGGREVAFPVQIKSSAEKRLKKHTFIQLSFHHTSCVIQPFAFYIANISKFQTV